MEKNQPANGDDANQRKYSELLNGNKNTEKKTIEMAEYQSVASRSGAARSTTGRLGRVGRLPRRPRQTLAKTLER